MTIASAQNTGRQVFTATGGQTAFSITFEFFGIADLNVYKNGTLATYNANPTTTTTYKVTASNSSSDSAYEFGTGATITFGSGLTANDKVVVVRRISIERTTDFPVNGTFDITALNTELDKAVAIFSDNKDQITRSIRLTDGDDTTPTLTIPATRADKILSFDSSSNVSVSAQPIAGGVTVSTLSVGASATATYNTSTGVLALGIPIGATGATGAAGGGMANLVSDTSPELGGDLDILAQDIVSSSNRTIDLAPHGTGTVVVKGNTNAGAIVLNCENNTHGQTVQAQPHSAGVTNTMLLPAGSNSTLVSESATQTLTNKTIDVAQLSGQVTIAKGGTGATTLAGANIVTTNAQNTFTKAQLPSTYTAALSATSGVLDYDTYQNFIITLASGSNTLAAPTTEASQIGQTGVIIFIQPSSSSAGTVSLHGDYETPASAGLTLSATNSAYDVVPYIVKADNSILLGSPQLAFG